MITSVLILDLCAFVLALLVALRLPRHWPVVAWLVGVPLVGILRVSVGWPDGIARALYLLPPCSLSALALHSLGRVSILPAVTWWLLLSMLGLVVRDPAPLYLAAYCGSVGLGVASEIGVKRLDATTGAVLASVVWASVDLLGPHAYGDPWRDHGMTEKIALAFLLVLCLGYVAALWTSRRA